MPDFERLIRRMEIETSKSPDIVKAFHAGEDHARKQIAWIVAVSALVFAVFYAVASF